MSHPVARVRKPAPAWTATAVVGQDFKDISLSNYKGKYVIMLFYPLEIIAFSERIEEFHKLNCEVIGVSVDSKYSHLAWVNTPRKEGGLGKIAFPLVADLTKEISRNYDVLVEEDGHTLRALFIIDAKGVVRQITKNDYPVGRSVDETLRLIQAFQFVDTHGEEACPVNWKPGQASIVTEPAKSKDYFGKTYV